MEPVKRCAIVRIDNMDPACQTFGVHHQFPVLVAGLLQPNLEAELVALRAGAVGEVECFGQYGATSLVAQSNHGRIVRARDNDSLAWNQPWNVPREFALDIVAVE